MGLHFAGTSGPASVLLSGSAVPSAAPYRLAYRVRGRREMEEKKQKKQHASKKTTRWHSNNYSSLERPGNNRGIRPRRKYSFVLAASTTTRKLMRLTRKSFLVESVLQMTEWHVQVLFALISSAKRDPLQCLLHYISFDGFFFYHWRRIIARPSN